ncbi:hypothetical protein [Rhodococcus sp. X156]|uniref:hypothetical protein n=1 Tax=Rhodococcus sp. X156 TaxID=2499145 RepID=UPI000FD91672|nr:hypothetical protein [Rhodococcus sp. X156]
MPSYLRLAGVVAVAAALTTACANSEEASTETGTTPPTTVSAPASSSSAPASSSAATSSAATSSAPTSSAAASAHGDNAFCDTLEKQDASFRTFGSLQLYAPVTARKEAQDARKQMGSATPPAEIAQDWTTWTGYLDFVIAQTETSTAASSAAFETLNTAQKKAEPSAQKLRTYYGDTCQ